MAKDARYFTHDSNARYDPKITALINRYGIQGYGRYWIIIEMLREATNYKLETESYVWDALAEQMHCKTDEAQKFVNDCVKDFKLLINGDGFFYSLSLVQRMQKLDDKRESNRHAANVRWGNE